MKRFLIPGILGYGLYRFVSHRKQPLIYTPSSIRNRKDNLESMHKEDYDLLIIGGGASGAGVALEASTRGLKSCLIEKGDFAGQTSSKSTKLLHGGVRYLEKAVYGEDVLANLALVKEGLRERSIILNSANLMTSWIPLAVPCTNWFNMIYFYSGMLVYHFIALMQSFSGPKIPWPKMSRGNSLLPSLKDTFVGAVIYYDGQMNDCRLCLEVLLTSTAENYIEGSVPTHIANYVSFNKFIFEKGKIVGAEVKDLITGEIFIVKSKVCVNCTGPFSDSVRKLGGLSDSRIVPGKGSHLMLPKSYAPHGTGMLIPKTQDGRVLFLVPWEDHTILGTTDEEGVASEHSTILLKEKLFLVNELSHYLKKTEAEITADIIGSFSGERPLVKKAGALSSSHLLRSHDIEIADSGLVSLLGGKWTTFRAMGEEAVEKIIQKFDLPVKSPSVTDHLIYISNHSATGTKKHLNESFALSEATVNYLLGHYGTRSSDVASLGTKELIKGYPFIEGEVIYAVRNEYALHPIDITARRIRLSLINYKESVAVLEKVTNLMAIELGWTNENKQLELKRSLEEMKQFCPD